MPIRTLPDSGLSSGDDDPNTPKSPAEPHPWDSKPYETPQNAMLFPPRSSGVNLTKAQWDLVESGSSITCKEVITDAPLIKTVLGDKLLKKTALNYLTAASFVPTGNTTRALTVEPGNIAEKVANAALTSPLEGNTPKTPPLEERTTKFVPLQDMTNKGNFGQSS